MTSVAVPTRTGGIVGWATSTDHKRIGLLMLGTSLVLFLVNGLLALLIRLELAVPGLQFLSRDGYNQVFTAHGSGMIYLVVTPAALAVGIYLVPLQIGAAGISAPRLVLLGYWLYALGAAVFYAALLTQEGGGRDGWTAAFPLSDSHFSPGSGMDLWLIGSMLAIGGNTIHGGALLTTVLRRRAPGMTMLRLPVFTWTQVVTCLMVVTAFPVVIVAFGLLLADRHGLGVYDSPGGQIGYQHLFWFYGHPVVYVMFFPFVGAVAEVVATFARRAFFGYKGTVLSLLAFAALSMSVWGHHMFTTGQVENQYYSLTSTALLVPAGIEYFGLIATLLGGSIVLATPMLFALGFILLFLIGGLSGIVVGSPPLDYHVHDSYFVVAHFHYTLFAGSMFGLFAGLYYWWPKATGYLLREGLGKLHFGLFFVGTNLAFFPMFILGQDGMPRRVADYSDTAGWTGLNQISTIGAFTIALGMLVFCVNVVLSSRRRIGAPADPWEGQTLEWWASSPPSRFNFESLPPIRSYAPLLDLREEDRAS